MSQASFDASIPVLTEVLKAEPVSDDGGAPPPVSAAAELEADAIDGWTEAEWAVMEHRLSVRIMHQLQSRVDFVLEQRIKDSMAEVLSHALHDLTNEIRIGLHDTIEKIVSRAVAQELTHLQAQKK
ncbi:hypothetical protein GJ698_03645 [Pseudoduganella sp. FT26W]|jgi:hypothetical protein|uniref:DUF2486 family protein n=2 Tax=Duganella TaxID=75654 RepID=A0A6L5QBY8_9BURK|nr:MULTISPECIES: hypothetical protein [Duganella]MRW83183.1 hypothetical protein [Duganella aquatilis]MRX07225.1 hypothetical protein [Duganella alba]MRX15080.1 hypothetical protein [Duganella alba]